MQSVMSLNSSPAEAIWALGEAIHEHQGRIARRAVISTLTHCFSGSRPCRPGVRARAHARQPRAPARHQRAGEGCEEWDEYSLQVCVFNNKLHGSAA